MVDHCREHDVIRKYRARVTMIRLLAAAGLLATAGASQAGSVTLDWVPLAGTGTSGTLVLNSAAITDPNNFTLTGSTAAIASDLTSFSYTFSGGTINNTLAHTLVAGTAAQLLAGTGSWTVSGGKLTSFFDIATTTNMGGVLGAYTLAGGIPGLTSPANALSGSGTYNSLTGTFSATLTAGYWQVAPVPLPAALPLLVSGMAGLGILVALRRRRADGAPGALDLIGT